VVAQVGSAKSVRDSHVQILPLSVTMSLLCVGAAFTPALRAASYRNAWHMCHRVRAGFAGKEFHKLLLDSAFDLVKAMNTDDVKALGYSPLGARAPSDKRFRGMLFVRKRMAPI
jgi:hypothetical protein